MQVYEETYTKTLYWRSYSTHEHTTVSLVLCLICQNLFKYSSVLYWWKSCKWSVNVIAIRVMSVVWYDTMCSDLTCTTVDSSRPFKVKGHAVNRNSKAMCGFLSDLHCVHVVSLTIFDIFDAKILWSRSRTVQGHPRSWDMVPTSGIKMKSLQYKN